MPRPVLVLAALLLAAPATAQQSAPSPERQAAEAEQYFVRGMTRAYVGDYEEAVELYERALGFAPDEAAVLAALAEAHEALGDATTAIFFASRAVAAAPDEPSGYRHLAGLQLSTGDTDGALDTYQRLLAADPRDVGALTALARIQQQSGRLDDALATYETLLARVGENGAVRVRMLAIYRQQDDTAGAVRALEALTALDPGNSTLQRELAEVYAATGRPADAIRTLEAFLAERPDDAEARLQLAGLYRTTGDAERADALLGSLGAVTNASADPTGQAAALYRRAEDDPDAADTALRLLETADANGSADAEALLMLGDLRFRAGAWAGAADALARALADDPRNPAAWAQRVEAHVRADQPDAALDVADEALLLFPGQVALLRASGFAHAGAGRLADALRLYAQALALLDEEEPDDDTERSRLLEYLGDAHDALGDPGVARQHWQAALDVVPADRAADRTRLRNKLDGAP